MPYYREKYDERNEKIMLRALGDRLGMAYTQTKRNCVYDAIFYRHGVAKFLAECKRRYHNYGDKRSLGIGKRKVTRVLEEARKHSTVPILAIGYDNGIYVTRLRPSRYEEKVGGRGDRGKHGLEMMYYIPIADFVPLAEFE